MVMSSRDVSAQVLPVNSRVAFRGAKHLRVNQYPVNIVGIMCAPKRKFDAQVSVCSSKLTSTTTTMTQTTMLEYSTLESTSKSVTSV